MTEAQKTLYYIAENMKLEKKISDEGYQHFQMAIKALEQEEYYKDLAQSYERTIAKLTEAIAEQQPSEDCVSRKAVAEIINKQRFGIHQISMGIIKEKIESLPTVTPTRKSGLHWIERFDDDDWDKWLECPHCHKDSDNAYNYCPNCGAEMGGTENG